MEVDGPIVGGVMKWIAVDEMDVLLLAWLLGAPISLLYG
jgi:hypothetical protein